MILFILTLNPLSFLLKKLSGCKLQNGKELTDLFFADDLKTFARTLMEAMKQLALITIYSSDIGMNLGLDKCAYLYIEGGKQKSLEKI